MKPRKEEEEEKNYTLTSSESCIIPFLFLQVLCIRKKMSINVVPLKILEWKPGFEGRYKQIIDQHFCLLFIGICMSVCIYKKR